MQQAPGPPFLLLFPHLTSFLPVCITVMLLLNQIAIPTMFSQCKVQSRGKAEAQLWMAVKALPNPHVLLPSPEKGGTKPCFSGLKKQHTFDFLLSR